MRKALPLLVVLAASVSMPLQANAAETGDQSVAQLTDTVSALGRRLQPANTRLPAARDLLVGPLAVAVLPQDRPVPALDQLAGKATLDMIPADFMLAQLRLQAGAGFDTSMENAIAGSETEAIFISAGPISLQELADRAGELKSGAVERRADGILVRAPIVIWQDAALVLAEGDRLLLSTADGAFVANSGLITLDHAAISGTAERNSRLNAFRPFVTTVRTGALQAQSSSFSNLGYGGVGATGGISISGAPLYPARLRSHVTSSIFAGISSLSFFNTADVLVADSRFDETDGPAIALKGVTRGQILGNVVTNTHKAQAIDIQNRSSDIDINGNVILDSRGTGIFLANDVSDIKIAGNILSGNGRGAISIVEGRCVDISSNIALTNAQVGIKVRASDRLSLSHNSLVGNAGAGISVLDQSVGASLQLANNSFSSNLSGIDGATISRLELSGNDFSRQFPVILDGELSAHTAHLLQASAGRLDGSGPTFTINPSGAGNSADCEPRS